jgi:hypothetical protein
MRTEDEIRAAQRDVETALGFITDGDADQFTKAAIHDMSCIGCVIQWVLDEEPKDDINNVIEAVRKYLRRKTEMN